MKQGRPDSVQATILPSRLRTEYINLRHGLQLKDNGCSLKFKHDWELLRQWRPLSDASEVVRCLKTLVSSHKRETQNSILPSAFLRAQEFSTHCWFTDVWDFASVQAHSLLKYASDKIHKPCQTSHNMTHGKLVCRSMSLVGKSRQHSQQIWVLLVSTINEGFAQQKREHK